MTDLAVLAVGFGAMPLAAILLYGFGGLATQHREASWGFLAGVIAFLGVSHAMAAVLVNHSLFGDPALPTTLSFVGLVVGAGMGWLFLEGPFIRTEPNRILAAAVAFLALHSFGDGLVLGAAFIGGVVPTIRIDAITVSATAVHRFLEGCVVVVPAMWAAWKQRPAFLLLFAALMSIPGAYIPGWIFSALATSPFQAETRLALSTFVDAMEATLGLFLLVRAFLPIASADRGSRWPAWSVVGFIAISLVHFFVE